MTATEELRRLLDERGVEWWPMHDDEAGYRDYRDTEFLVYGCKHVAHEWGCRLQVDMLTPEQAVEATLGRGTCRRMPADDATVKVKRGCFETEFPYFECSECGSYVMDNARYCPICGARVVG